MRAAHHLLQDTRHLHKGVARWHRKGIGPCLLSVSIGVGKLWVSEIWGQIPLPLKSHTRREILNTLPSSDEPSPLASSSFIVLLSSSWTGWRVSSNMLAFEWIVRFIAEEEMVILPNNNTHPSGFVVILCEDVRVGFLGTYYKYILRMRKKDIRVGMWKTNETIVCVWNRRRRKGPKTYK